MISRTCFCESCFQKHRPQPNDIFVLVGGVSKELFVCSAFFDKYQSQHKALYYGFTPHILLKRKIHNGNILFDKCCGMRDCGITITDIKSDNPYVSFINVTQGSIPITEWNAMISNPNIGYHI